ncbi:LysE family translocator [Fibrella forsythiae]|uniref:LysE family translocator n=1 Tax=Fibrella forsythiae TaxID=2817061 RepID=A0ABS3JEA2_9BACT|nr:LysE family translocator [Fibrella forsythiae]MBO0948334.1 LysE family translocator [Fibrella forsythiae]
MFGIDNFAAFVLAGILLNMTPGSDTMYILGRSLSQGMQAGIYSALGITVGCLVHTFLAAFGLSILIAESQLAFNIVKYLGAAYLFYLGIRMILTRDDTAFDVAAMTKTNYRQLVVSGIVTNVLNPKVALFFIAFLPQFVQKTYSHTSVSFLLLGLTFNLTGTIWNLMLAIFSANMSAGFKRNQLIKTWLNRFTGTLFILLGIKLAVERSH